MAELKDYKLKEIGKHHVTLTHPDGSEFKIAKKGLNKAHMAKIQMLADGGEVQDPSKSFAQNLKDGFSSVSNAFSAPQITDDYVNQKMFGYTAPAAPTVAQTDSTQPTPVSAQDQVSATQDPTPATPQGASASQQLASAQGLEAQGVKESVAAKTEEGNALAANASNTVDQMKVQNEAYQKHLDFLNGQTEVLYNAATSDKVDPERYWNSKSTANKISSVIAIVLGGAFGRGNGNGAVDSINKSIEQDIDAQKANIQNKNSLLNINLARTRNMNEAEAITRTQLLAMAGAQVSKIQAQSMGPNAKSQGDILLGQLKTQAIAENAKLAASTAKTNLATGAGNVNPEMLDKDTRERLVQLPNGQQKLAYSPEDAKEIRTSLATVQPINDQLDKLDKLGPSALVPGSKAYNQAQAIRAELVPLINENAGLKRLSGEDIKNINNMIRDPSSFSQLTGGATRSQTLRDFIGNKMQATYQSKLEGYKPAYVPKSVTPGYTRPVVKK